MFTSVKSKTLTALLWGDRWWIEGRDEPFGDLHRAAEVLLAHFAQGGKPARLRLIFQPESLLAHSVACPRGNRDLLQLALSEQFPVLANDELAWGFEPIVGGSDQFATVLYHETQAGLFALVQALHDGGIEIEGAWPLGTVLNLVPDDWPDTGVLTVVAVAENRTLAYRHMADGRREVEAATGTDAAASALNALRTALARTDTAIYLVGCDPAGERLAAQLPAPDVPRVRLLSWSTLVRAASTLSRSHPSQLLPIPSRWSPRRALLAASSLAAIAALGFFADAARLTWMQRTAAAAQRSEAATLRTEIAARRDAQRELAMLRAAVEAGEPATAVFAPWLRELAAKLPREAVLTRVAATRSRIAVEGGVTGPMTDPAWRQWLDAITAPGTRWQMKERPPLPVAAFQLTAHAPQ